MNWYPSFRYRRKVTVSNSNASDLTNAPVAIKFPTSGAILAPRHGDVRVTAADGITPLPFFLETRRVAADHDWLWVKVPSIPAQGSVDIYVYTGNPIAVSADTPSSVCTAYHSFANQSWGPFTNSFGSCSSVSIVADDSLGSGYVMQLVDSGSGGCGRYSAQNTFFNATKKRFVTWLKLVSYSGSQGDISIYPTYGTQLRCYATVGHGSLGGIGGDISYSTVGQWFRIEVVINLDASVVTTSFWGEDGTLIGTRSGAPIAAEATYRDILFYQSLENVGTAKVGGVYAFDYSGGNLPSVALGNQETNAAEGPTALVLSGDASVVESVGSAVANNVGDGTIVGTVKRLGVPARRRVTLLDRRSMRPIQTVWSDASGNYRFDNVDRNFRYLVICDDYAQEYNAAVADWVEPE